MTKRTTTAEFIKRARKAHGRRYDYSKTVYKSAKEKVEIICLVHGSFWQNPNAHSRASQGCPSCSGKKASDTNNLLTIHPEIAKEWHPTKNGTMKPEDFTKGSDKSIWWRCQKSAKHEWLARIQKRTSGRGCPFCAGKKILLEDSLLARLPNLASQWHPTKNGVLSPKDFGLGSEKRIWWRCDEDPEHVWDAPINRRSKGSGCPFCSGRRPTKKENLLALDPILAKEWHPTKNGSKSPKDFKLFSSAKVWWLCRRFKSHEWEAVISSRANGHGCPKCSNQTSSSELRIYSEINLLFKDALNRTKVHGQEVDIFIPSKNLAIEFDGAFFHMEKEKRDKAKQRILANHGIKMIRVREPNLPSISSHDICLPKAEITKEVINKILKRIVKLSGFEPNIAVTEYLSERSFQNDEVYRNNLAAMPGPAYKKSLAFLSPELSSEWDFQKNNPLTPSDFTPGSNKKAWWKCKVNEHHSWASTIKNRIAGNGCPFCGKKRPSREYNLLSAWPEIALEWHPVKNGNRKPDEFLPFSNLFPQQE